MPLECITPNTAMLHSRSCRPCPRDPPAFGVLFTKKKRGGSPCPALKGYLAALAALLIVANRWFTTFQSTFLTNVDR
jgi:hypothetical protein